MSDCLIVGGGVIGLSLAYELAGHGLRVRLIDCGQPGREASWAGAGILPPAAASSRRPARAAHVVEQSPAPSMVERVGRVDGHRQRVSPLRARFIWHATNPKPGNSITSRPRPKHATSPSIAVSDDELARLEPGLRPSGGAAVAYSVPDECQIRNPRHLKALVAACLSRGVEITPGVAAEEFVVRHDRVRAVQTNVGQLSADRVCLTTGCWTGALVRRLGIAAGIKPVRGQMVLLSLARPNVSRIINEGSRYLVPRGDGRLLVGSTEEDAGFDRGTTAGGIAGLLEFAFSLVPDLRQAPIERTWAGLRPATRDGLPYLGQVNALENVFVAAGHFRGGLQLSTGTAEVMSQLIRGQQPQIDLDLFRLNRVHVGDDHDAANGDSGDTPPAEFRRPRRQATPR